MKPTKKIESEVWKVYESWLHSYLNGDVETYNSYLDKDYHFIGSTDNEEFLSKKDTTQFFADTAAQLAGKCYLRKETKIIEQFESLVFITHLFDAWFKTEKDWAYYGRFRFTSTLKKTKEGWRFIYQHFSTTDSKTDEGETIGFNKVNEENQELREAIQRRTIELEHKNKELEIERALEKVRAVALSMWKPEDLPNVCEVVFNELKTLGFPELRNAMVNIHNDEKRTFVNYDYSDEIGKSITPLFYDIHPVIKKQIKKIRGADDAFSETLFKGKDLESWKEFRKNRGEKEDKRIKNSTALYYYFYSIGTGSIGISTFDVITDEKQKLLQRFRNVFQLAYKRFIDISLAEAQAREAQIEVALERVRARSMAMQTSEELTEAGALLYQELSKLDIKNLATGYTLFDENAIMGWSYGVNPFDGSIRHKPVGMNHTTTKVMKAIAASWKKKEPILAIQLNEQETIKHQTFIAEDCIGFPISKEKLLSISPKKLVVHTFNFKQGYLLIVGGELLTIEQQEMITRFAKVFEQTYTRFLDLQKAEAQTRESEIELALERVRARTMAMQKSEELKDVIQTVYEQFINLKINIEHTGFIIDYKKNDDMHIWLADKNEVATKIVLPYFDSVHWNSFKEAKTKGENFFANQLSFKEKNKFYKDLFKLIPDVPKDLLEIYLGYSGLAISTVLMDNVGLYMENFDGTPYSEEENEILMRFGKVFQQTYTRFLDLQKAEAQSRESKIQLSMERVRAKAMAMHNSDDLAATIRVFYEEFVSLSQTPIIRCGAGVFRQKTSIVDLSSISLSPDNELVEIRGSIDMSGHPLLQGVYKNWLLQKEYSHVLKGNEIKDYYQYMKGQVTIPDYPDDAVQHSLFPMFPEGSFYVFTEEPLLDEDLKTFRRFNSVLSLTYRRYNDLQKAEAQAREAKIETALEKVRTVALSLKKSDEMLDIAKVLYEQLQVLGFKDIRNALIDINDEKTETFMDYDYSELMGGTITQMSYNDDPTLEEQLQVIAKTTDGFSEMVLEGKQLQDLIKMRRNNGEADDPRLLAASSVSYILYAFGNGAIGISNFGKLNDNQNGILERFRNVFTFAYNRHSELAKAESQMREVQLEASLEKMRSVALSMQKPDDMLDIAQALFEQLRDLGFVDIRNAIIDVHNEDNETFWDYDYSEAMSGSITLLSYKNDPTLEEQYRKIVSTTNGFYEEIIEGEELKEYVEMRIRNGEKEDPRLREIDLLSYYLYSFGNGVIGISNFSILNEAQKTILERFRNVFTFAYQRYIDLAKAEAQARKSQIEIALERTRTQSMLMQHSNELDATSKIFHEQLQLLGIATEFSYVWLPDEAKNEHKFWVAWNVEKKGDTSIRSKAIVYPMNKTETYTASCFKDWASGKPIHIHQIEPKDVATFFSAWEELLKDAKKLNPKYFSKGLFYAEAFMKYGCFGINIKRPITEEEKQILQRFSVEFERTYTRFLDLQKAEAQAREAQIEAALEKVRSRSLAMHKPDELQEVVAVVAEKLKDLGVIFDAGGVILCTYFPDNKDVVHWIAIDDFSTSGRYLLPYFDNPIFSEAWDSKIRGDAFFSKEFPVETKNHFFEQAFEHSDYKYMPEKYKKFVLKAEQHRLSAAWSKNSAILIPSLTGAVPSKNDAEIMKRFANVFEQAYIRFMDLQKAEARARESQIDIALERVRSRTMGMQKSDELAETSAVLFQQINELASETWSCGFCIWQDNDEVELWMGADSGGLLPPMLIPFKKEPTHRDIYEASFKQEPEYHKIWNGKALENHYTFLRTIPSVAKAIKVMEDSGLTLPEQQCYYVGFFKHGYLLLITKEPSDNLIELSKRFAQVFDLTYTRFLDLQLKERQSVALIAEKQRLEKTLSDLQTTQKQLIQSEKMASLGELTAGIAHEIQNPLNFVNNFSEVSNELLDEMEEEMQNGNYDEAKELLNDIKQNLEKINTHGKRADGIVKGMLQHSRKSSAEKEPTDINKLADEYLRLAYHGLRAKDKSFNATLETDFDETIGKINVIPQDIGRVILNLITNAFYACSERSGSTTNERKASDDNYKPTVSVSTKKEKEQILISVKDNGNGIPKHVLDKIFQPFFTTKPTGQGTGLGLSMSYDIVTKAHGGELKVETKEGLGTTFIITIPK